MKPPGDVPEPARTHEIGISKSLILRLLSRGTLTSVYPIAMEHTRAFILFMGGLLTFAQSPALLAQPVNPASNDTATSSNKLVSNAWDVLNGAMADKDVQHRIDAVAAFGAIGPAPKIVRIVEGALQDKDQHVRQTAARTLGEMKATAAIPYLKAAMDDTPEVSFTAAKAL